MGLHDPRVLSVVYGALLFAFACIVGVVIFGMIRAKVTGTATEARHLRTPMVIASTLGMGAVFGLLVLFGIVPWWIWVAIVAAWSLLIYAFARGTESLEEIGKARTAEREAGRHSSS